MLEGVTGQGRNGGPLDLLMSGATYRRRAEDAGAAAALHGLTRSGFWLDSEECALNSLRKNTKIYLKWNYARHLQKPTKKRKYTYYGETIGNNY